jgi:hypothetical protein
MERRVSTNSQAGDMIGSILPLNVVPPGRRPHVLGRLFQ